MHPVVVIIMIQTVLVVFGIYGIFSDHIAAGAKLMMFCIGTAILLEFMKNDLESQANAEHRDRIDAARRRAMILESARIQVEAEMAQRRQAEAELAQRREAEAQRRQAEAQHRQAEAQRRQAEAEADAAADAAADALKKRKLAYAARMGVFATGGLPRHLGGI